MMGKGFYKRPKGCSVMFGQTRVSSEVKQTVSGSKSWRHHQEYLDIRKCRPQGRGFIQKHLRVLLANSQLLMVKPTQSVTISQVDLPWFEKIYCIHQSFAPKNPPSPINKGNLPKIYYPLFFLALSNIEVFEVMGYPKSSKSLDQTCSYYNNHVFFFPDVQFWETHI